MKKTTSVLLSSFTAIALSASLIAGSTFALFTSESKIDIAVTSGKVDVTATIDETSLKAYTVDQTTGEKQEADGTAGEATFPITLGKATLGSEAEAPDLTIDNFVPGNSIAFDIDVENKSSIAVKYQFGTAVQGEDGADALFYDALKLSLTEDGEEVALVGNGKLFTRLSSWRFFEPKAEGETIKLHVVIDFPIDFANNAAQGKTCSFNFTVSAVQANAATAEPIPVEADGTYSLSSETEFKALGDMVAMGNSFEGETVELSGDVTVTDDWEPIGTIEHPFEGTLDGNGHTVDFGDHTYQMEDLIDELLTGSDNTLSLALFNRMEEAEISNLTVEGSLTLTGTIETNNTYDNIQILLSGVCAAASVSSGGMITHSTIDVDIDCSDLDFTGPGSATIMIGGVAGVLGGGTVSNCIYTGTIKLPKNTLKSEFGTVQIMVGGIYIMGSNLGGMHSVAPDHVVFAGKIENVPEAIPEDGSVAIGGIVAAVAPSAAIGWYSIGFEPVGLMGTAGKKLSADEAKEQSNFPDLDFETTWDMGDTHPVLR